MPSAVFVLQRDDGRVLMETRGPKDKYFPNGTIYPGGKLEPGEVPVDGMLREAFEELGILPLWHRPLITGRYLYYLPISGTRHISDTDVPELAPFRVYAFLIRSWNGDVPSAIKDTGNPVSWYLMGEASTGNGCTHEITAAVQVFDLEELDIQASARRVQS